MSDDFANARADSIASLREYGEPLLIQRPAIGYDSSTRKRATGFALSQNLYGYVSPTKAGNSRFDGSETKRFERTAVLSPEGMTFEPAPGDVLTAEGKVWRIGDNGVTIIRGGGVVIVIKAGLVAL